MTVTTTTNPFSTRRVRPGAIPYLFRAGSSAEHIVLQLQENGWRGQVIGPHGTGKSTLVCTLIPYLEQAGRQIHLYTLNDRGRRLPIQRADVRAWNSTSLIVVDGFEQLGRWSRWKLRRACLQQNAGLLVTTHCDVGLPTLIRTSVDLSMATAIVASLLSGCERAVAEQEIARHWSDCRGNMREMLFRLYDVYERQRNKP